MQMVVGHNGGWRKSSRCETGTCVEVAFLDDTVSVRDSKHPDGPKLFFTDREWEAFIAGARAGEFDIDVV